jgi:hypothetical protein
MKKHRDGLGTGDPTFRVALGTGISHVMICGRTDFTWLLKTSEVFEKQAQHIISVGGWNDVLPISLSI